VNKVEEILLKKKKKTFIFSEFNSRINELIIGRSVVDMIVSLYCDNKFDNLSRINARSKNLEKINVPPYDIKSIKMKNLYSLFCYSIFGSYH
jgi:hypothetical protein